MKGFLTTQKLRKLSFYLHVVLSSVKLSTAVNFSETGNSEIRLNPGLPSLYFEVCSYFRLEGNLTFFKSLSGFPANFISLIKDKITLFTKGVSQSLMNISIQLDKYYQHTHFMPLPIQSCWYSWTQTVEQFKSWNFISSAKPDKCTFKTIQKHLVKGTNFVVLLATISLILEMFGVFNLNPKESGRVRVCFKGKLF